MNWANATTQTSNHFRDLYLEEHERDLLLSRRVCWSLFSEILPSYLRSITAMVMRLMHVSSCCSLVMRISQTWVFFPMWIGFVIPITNPSRTLLMWLALISKPTQYCLLIST